MITFIMRYSDEQVMFDTLAKYVEVRPEYGQEPHEVNLTLSAEMDIDGNPIEGIVEGRVYDIDPDITLITPTGSFGLEFGDFELFGGGSYTYTPTDITQSSSALIQWTKTSSKRIPENRIGNCNVPAGLIKTTDGDLVIVVRFTDEDADLIPEVDLPKFAIDWRSDEVELDVDGNEVPMDIQTYTIDAYDIDGNVSGTRQQLPGVIL